jgi:hypothetical protein
MSGGRGFLHDCGGISVGDDCGKAQGRESADRIEVNWSIVVGAAIVQIAYQASLTGQVRSGS